MDTCDHGGECGRGQGPKEVVSVVVTDRLQLKTSAIYV